MGRASVIVIDPELEVWVWSQSPEVDRALGWSQCQPDLRTWLQSQDLLQERGQKPPDPKSAMQQALRRVRKPHSAAIFAQLAEHVGIQRCRDSAFLKLRNTLRRWFEAQPRAGACPDLLQVHAPVSPSSVRRRERRSYTSFVWPGTGTGPTARSPNS